jgi:hypothetical protein
MSTAETENAPKDIDTGLAAAFAEGNAWFSQLPATTQTDVVKYAVVQIANNSKLFELRSKLLSFGLPWRRR